MDHIIKNDFKNTTISVFTWCVVIWLFGLVNTAKASEWVLLVSQEADNYEMDRASIATTKDESARTVVQAWFRKNH